jgi:hypothetical protein
VFSLEAECLESGDLGTVPVVGQVEVALGLGRSSSQLVRVPAYSGVPAATSRCTPSPVVGCTKPGCTGTPPTPGLPPQPLWHLLVEESGQGELDDLGTAPAVVVCGDEVGGDEQRHDEHAPDLDLVSIVADLAELRPQITHPAVVDAP